MREGLYPGGRIFFCPLFPEFLFRRLFVLMRDHSRFASSRICFSLSGGDFSVRNSKSKHTNGNKADPEIREIRMNIYVGNLPYSIDRDELRGIFEQYGEVSAARVVSDRETGRSKGFGFVEMPDAAQAQAAIDALNGNEIGGRKAVVNEARPREERPPRR